MKQTGARKTAFDRGGSLRLDQILLFSILISFPSSSSGLSLLMTGSVRHVRTASKGKERRAIPLSFQTQLTQCTAVHPHPAEGGRGGRKFLGSSKKKFPFRSFLRGRGGGGGEGTSKFFRAFAVGQGISLKFSLEFLALVNKTAYSTHTHTHISISFSYLSGATSWTGGQPTFCLSFSTLLSLFAAVPCLSMTVQVSRTL